MPQLTFESEFDTDIHHPAWDFMFMASDGENRFKCYVSRDDVSDFHELPGRAKVEHLDFNRAKRCAQASYDLKRLESDEPFKGDLTVNYMRPN